MVKKPSTEQLKQAKNKILPFLSKEEGIQTITKIIKDLQQEGKLTNINLESFSRLAQVEYKGRIPVCEKNIDFHNYTKDFFQYHLKNKNLEMLDLLSLLDKLFIKEIPKGRFSRWVIKNKEVLTTIAPYLSSCLPYVISASAVIVAAAK